MDKKEIHYEVNTNLVRFENSLGELAVKLEEPGKKIYTFKKVLEKIKQAPWKYIALGVGVLMAVRKIPLGRFLFFRKGRRRVLLGK